MNPPLCESRVIPQGGILERIYSGRRFKNDTERLEKLFELYTKMTAQQSKPNSRATAKEIDDLKREQATKMT